jgi:hypothetical protein
MVAVLVGGWVVDELDTAGRQGLVEAGVLLGGHHPAAVDPNDGTRLHGHAADGPFRLPLHEGVMVDQCPLNAKAVSSGGLDGGHVVGAMPIQRIEGVKDKHGIAWLFRRTSFRCNLSLFYAAGSTKGGRTEGCRR